MPGGSSPNFPQNGPESARQKPVIRPRFTVAHCGQLRATAETPWRLKDGDDTECERQSKYRLMWVSPSGASPSGNMNSSSNQPGFRRNLERGLRACRNLDPIKGIRPSPRRAVNCSPKRGANSLIGSRFLHARSPRSRLRRKPVGSTMSSYSRRGSPRRGKPTSSGILIGATSVSSPSSSPGEFQRVA